MTSLNRVSATSSLSVNSPASGIRTPIVFIGNLPRRVLNILYSWQNWPNKTPRTLTQSDTPFRDISPSKGDNETDYGKPVWRR